MKRFVSCVGWLFLLVLVPVANAQLQVGDDVRMNLNGLITAGYTGNYGDYIQSNHDLELGGNATLNGSYYNPNFLNFSVAPFYNQSRANSNFQSLTDSSGVNANVNLFTGSRFPGYASYSYLDNSTGTFGLIGTPDFTTVGRSQGFGVGWSALVPNWPTFSVNYSQGTGNGTVYGTNEESNSSTHTLNVRSTYAVAGWRLSGQYDHLNISTNFPTFLVGEVGMNTSDFVGNDFGANANHSLPWRGNMAITYNHFTYSGDFGSTLVENAGTTKYTTDTETFNATFRPTDKLSLFVNQSFTNNLNGFLYQNVLTPGSGLPLFQFDTQSNSSTMAAGANYNFTKNLYGQAQLTYYDQNYLGSSYEGTYFSGTVGYGKRIMNIFTVSATVIESSNKFANNSLGFIGNLNAFHRFGLWETSGNLSYAQNVQTLLVTYTESYYSYGANLHRRFNNIAQWTVAFNGTHSGFTQDPGTLNHSVGASTSFGIRHIDFNANYIKSRGQAVLTTSGIQPITTPGLAPLGWIVYNGESYGAGITLTPFHRLTISGAYSHATSDTLSAGILSNNKTDIFYSQLQYRLRQINLLAGYTKFSQGISAAGVPAGSEYSYFVGVSRWINFF